MDVGILMPFASDGWEGISDSQGVRRRAWPGLTRLEYEPFRDFEMDQSRGCYDEGTAMAIEALRTGFIEGDGPYFKQ